MKRFTLAMLTLLVAVVLASCGGGGGTGSQSNTGADNNPGSGDVTEFDTDGDGIAEESSGPAGVDAGDDLENDPDRRTASIPNETPDQPEGTVRIPVISPIPAEGTVGPDGEQDWDGIEMIETTDPSALEEEGPVGRFDGSGERSASQTGGGGGGFVIDRRVIKSTVYQNLTGYMFRGYSNSHLAGTNDARVFTDLDYDFGSYDGTDSSSETFRGWSWRTETWQSGSGFTNLMGPLLRGFVWGAHLRPGADNRWIAEGSEQWARPGSAGDHRGFYIRRAEAMDSLLDGNPDGDRPHCPDLILLSEMANLYQRQDFQLMANRNWTLYWSVFLDANGGNVDDAAEDFVAHMIDDGSDIGGTGYDGRDRASIGGWDLHFCIDGARLAGDSEAASAIAEETLDRWGDIQNTPYADGFDYTAISQAGLISALSRLDVSGYSADIDALFNGGSGSFLGSPVNNGLFDFQDSQYGYFGYDGPNPSVDSTQLGAYALSAMADYKDALEADGGSAGLQHEVAIDKTQDWFMLYAQVQDQNTDFLEDIDLDGYSDRGAFLSSVIGFSYGDSIYFEPQGEVVRALVAASEGKQPFPLGAGQVAP